MLPLTGESTFLPQVLSTWILAGGFGAEEVYDPGAYNVIRQ